MVRLVHASFSLHTACRCHLVSPFFSVCLPALHKHSATSALKSDSGMYRVGLALRHSNQAFTTDKSSRWKKNFKCHFFERIWIRYRPRIESSLSTPMVRLYLETTFGQGIFRFVLSDLENLSTSLTGWLPTYDD